MKLGYRKSMREKLQKFAVSETDCWVWQGSTDKDGYGAIGRVGGAHLKAHRESYREYVCDPGEAQVLHTCDNPPCINPEHLYLGDPALNGEDKRVRGRARTRPQLGEENAASKLKEAEVIAIRKLYSEGGMTQREIGARFGVAQSAISKIVRNEAWRGVCQQGHHTVTSCLRGVMKSGDPRAEFLKLAE